MEIYLKPAKMKLVLVLVVIFNIVHARELSVFLKPPSNERIVNGVEVDIANFPWQLSLRYNGNHRCGAAVLSNEWIVTAAHCVIGINEKRPTQLSFCAGRTKSSSNLLRCAYRARELINHPQFNTTTMDNDVALIRVPRFFPLNLFGAKPVALVPVNYNTPVATSVIVTGWGAMKEGGGIAPTLRGVGIQIIDQDICDFQLSKYGGVTSNMICAGVPDGSKDSCQGDSGGPLVDLQKRLVGLVSWGIGCAKPGLPGVYTRISSPSIRNFIQKHTRL